MESSNTTFRPFSKADLEKAQAARRPKAVPVVQGVPMTTTPQGHQIPDGRVAARYNAAAQHSQQSQQMQPEDYNPPPERPRTVNISPNQAPLNIPGQDQGALFGRHPDGTPLNPQEFFAQRSGKVPQGQAPTVGGMPAPQHQYQRTNPMEHFAPPPSHSSAIQYQQIPPVSLNFVNEAEGVAVDLPSGFAFYPFKDLFVYPLRGYHLAKLARAHAERSQLIMLEVVSSVIRTSDPAFQGVALAPMLLLNDYYWLLYFMRQNNYTKTTFVHTTRCLDPKHLKEVEDGLKSEDSLKIQQVISKSTLTEKKLEQIPTIDPKIMGGIEVRPATMRDMMETMEHPMFGKDHEFDYLSQVACYLYGDTLEDRIRVAATLGPDQIAAIQEYEDVLSNFGTEETIVVKCKDCGAQRRTRVRIDASTFLPA